MYLILGNTERKTGRAEGKICCRPEVVKQERSEEGISRQSSPKLFQSQCPPPINPTQGTLVKHKEKATQRAPTLPELPVSALSFSYPFLPERQILKDFPPNPPRRVNLREKSTQPHSVGTERALVFFRSKG